MDPKDKVKAQYPDAVTTSYRLPSGNRYYITWTNGSERGRRFATGRTPEEAWLLAASLLDQEKAVSGG